MFIKFFVILAIVTHGGQRIQIKFDSESDCVAMSRMIGPGVRSANCYTVIPGHSI